MRFPNPLGSYGRLILLSLLVGAVVFAVFALPRLRVFNDPATVTGPIGENVTATPTTKLPPTRVRIPKLNKDLPIQAALVHDNQWDMFDKAIAWLSTSAVPGEGNVILYGHNWKSLIGDLYKLNAGDVIEVEQGGQWKRYSVTESRAVQAKDVSSILSDQDQLTIFTCEGSFDQKRRVVYANPL